MFGLVFRFLFTITVVEEFVPLFSSVPCAGFEPCDHRVWGRVALGHFEAAKVLSLALALVDGSEDVDVLVLRVRHSRPGQLH